jgi:uncharacterized protein DUF4333
VGVHELLDTYDAVFFFTAHDERRPSDPAATVPTAVRLPVFLAAVAAGAGGLAGCGSSKPALNTRVVQRAVASSILAQRHVHATVACPSKVPRRAGLQFTCMASLEVGTYPVSVVETNAAGRVRYESRAPLIVLDIAAVERAIRQSILSQRRLRSTVTCPAEVIQQAGIVFTCTATVSDKRYPFTVTEVDGNGHVRYIGRRAPA